MKKVLYIVVSAILLLFVAESTFSHSYTTGDCCRHVYGDCEARPDHAYPLCRFGHQLTDQYNRWWIPRCWGTGCMGGLPGCFPDLEDSQCQDSDQDTIPDFFENNAFDPTLFDDDNTLLDLTGFGAHHQRKDIFVEIDCVESDGNSNGVYTDAVDHSHCPVQNAIEQVVQAFANAPVNNPDGTSGIQLHVDTGDLYGAGVIHNVAGTGGVTGNYGDLRDTISGALVGGGNRIDETGNETIDWDGIVGRPGTKFYDLKDDNFNKQLRQTVFRYVIFGHQTNARRAANDCTSGRAESIIGNDFMIMLGGTNAAGANCWGNDANGFSVGSTDEQAGTFMHELGHTLGLIHGGIDGINHKPNYLSLMNYAFQDCSVPASPLGIIPGGCDYSRIVCPQVTGRLNETNLDECLGINCGLGFGAIDWNLNGIFEGVSNCAPPNNTNITMDINGDDFCVDPGRSGLLDSAVNINDLQFGQRILDGVDRCCNSLALPDDDQRKAQGSCQPNELIGFEDWNAIRYDFQTQPSYADGVTSPMPDEATPEDIRQAKRYMANLMEPVLSIEKTVSANIVPGETATYTIRLRNTGRGPALKIVITETLPDGSTKEVKIPVVVAGAEEITTLEFKAPSGQHFCETLENNIKVEYKDFVGNKKTATFTLVPKYEYAAKIICGPQKEAEDMRLARGFYATTINVHNPNRSDVTFCKKLALAYPPGKQTAGEIKPIAIDTLKYDEALAVDCMDIKNRLYPDGFPASYIEGFVVMQSTESLDVNGVYSTATLNKEGKATNHSSIEVERINGRLINKDKEADLAIKKEIKKLHSYSTGNAVIKSLQYSVRVTNKGPSMASNITIEDELEIQGGYLFVAEDQFEATHGGSWALDSSDQTSASLIGKIPGLAASETATLKFVIAITIISQQGQEGQQAELTNKAAVYSDVTDPVLSNNSDSVVTQEP